MPVSFDYRSRLGSGYFGEVWRVIETGLDIEVALKLIPPDKIINRSNFFQEAQVLKTAEHPNIVHVYDTGTLTDGIGFTFPWSFYVQVASRMNRGEPHFL